MVLSVRAFWTPKGGHDVADYEDAFAVDAARMRFAITDGATESSFSASWAKDLANQFAAGTGTPKSDLDWQSWLAPIQERWRIGIDWNALPWFAVDKANQGAFSTLLGLEFHLPPEAQTGWQWSAVAVGDSCLFQLRAGSLLTPFPLTSSGHFNNRPLLLASQQNNNRAFTDVVRMIPPSPVSTGDQFMLATDAVADWFLRQHEAGKQPARELAALVSQQDFAGWTARQRLEGRMRNDDATLVIVDCLPPLPSAATAQLITSTPQ